MDLLFNSKVNSFVIFISSFFIAASISSYPKIYIILSLLNVPIYLYVGKRYFCNTDDLIDSLDNSVNGDDISGPTCTDEESWQSIKGQFYILTCLAFVTCEYKLWVSVFY